MFDDLWGEDPHEAYVRTEPEPEKRHGDDKEDNIAQLAFGPPHPVNNTIVQRHKMIIWNNINLRQAGRAKN
jgi:hypothetical protein